MLIATPTELANGYRVPDNAPRDDILSPLTKSLALTMAKVMARISPLLLWSRSKTFHSFAAGARAPARADFDKLGDQTARRVPSRSAFDKLDNRVARQAPTPTLVKNIAGAEPITRLPDLNLAGGDIHSAVLTNEGGEERNLAGLSELVASRPVPEQRSSRRSPNLHRRSATSRGEEGCGEQI
nr:hypothetical protein Iba_chr06dCG10570 [Ipomoea batatas]